MATIKPIINIIGCHVVSTDQRNGLLEFPLEVAPN